MLSGDGSVGGRLGVPRLRRHSTDVTVTTAPSPQWSGVYEFRSSFVPTASIPPPSPTVNTRPYPTLLRGRKVLPDRHTPSVSSRT